MPVLRLATLKVEKTTDNELFYHLVTELKPKIDKKMLLSSEKSFEEACIAVKHTGVEFIEYSVATQYSSNDST